MIFLAVLLLSAHPVAKATVTVPNIGLVQPPPANVAQATFTQSSMPLFPDADNRATLQSFLDSLPAGVVVMMPSGVWPVYATLNGTKSLTIKGAGINSTTIVGQGADYAGPVFKAGVYDTIKVDNIVLEDIAFKQEGRSPTQKHTCVNIHGDHFRATRVKIEGSQYEGIQVDGNCVDALFTDCVGVDCGNGGPAYTLSTSAFNSHARDTHYINCRTTGCGQGCECGSRGTIVEGCTFENPGAGGPSIGINVGSNAWGVHDVKIMGNFVRGYPSGIGCGNGIGRLSKVEITGNVVDGGTIGFMGGKTTNAVPGNPNEGPDLYGSICSGNTIIVRQANGGALLYNTGPEATAVEFGRENLTMDSNTIVSLIPSNAEQQVAMWTGCAGKITAIVKITNTKIFNSDVAPDRGDIASESNNASVAVPGMPTLSLSNNRVFRWDGAERSLNVRIEGSP